MSKTPQRRVATPGRLLLTAALSAGIVVGGASSAGASESCGGIEVTFDGVRLLNDGVENTAGPFDIELPAGTYDITMSSWDHHDVYHQPDQENEQWYFTLDSGYTSGVSVDVPTEETTSVTHLGAQLIDASTSITLHHLGESNVNSVEPTCVGFTLIPEPEPENEANDVPVEAEPAVDDVVVNDVVVEPEEVADEVIDAEVKGIVELPSQTVEMVPPASMVNPPSAVEAAQVAQAPVLALTGSSTTTTGALLGVLFTAIGGVFMWMASSAPARRRAVVKNS